ncbi:hypothetical protein B7G54_04550 [Burkholderia puraquae]|uniref:Vitamin B12 import ATP-binding protein BtuD n=1 Tax=Burkholderia puraquae TaxID=1904757 RepID=A0A1X1PMI6_9BURK|nr:hypothetical protein B7G54_04550 [Burkholderia puraquae]CAB3751495.1 Vitamin B12 import ATP-binding protein BtuD [Burkholderia puraquae]
MHCYTLARRPICAALFGAFGLSAAPAHADSTPQGATPPTAILAAASTRGDAALLDPVTVTANRTATAASRTAASVSVITDEDLEEQQATNIKDALRYEPGHGAPHRVPARAGADTLVGRDVTTLSGGELARVQFARVLAQLWPDDDATEGGPRYLLLDEPTAALDLAHQHRLLDTVRAVAREWRLGVLAIVHDPNLAARHADTIAMLADGTIVAHGTPRDVMTPAHIAQCYGFAVKMVETGDGTPPVMVPA